MVLRAKIDVGASHRLMGWMIRHAAWILNRFQIKSDGRTAYRNTRNKDHDRELVLLGEICLFRNHDAHETKLELQMEETNVCWQDREHR